MLRLSKRRRPVSPAASSRRPPAAEALETRVLLATQTFGNPRSINLPDDFSPPTPATFYPSFATVSGVEGQVSEIRVALSSLVHNRPEDIDVLLVSPAGKSVILMSDAGANFPAEGVELEFSDFASQRLPDLSRINTGTYKPTNYDSDDIFPDPAPFDPPTDTSLMALAADDPNGEWQLYVVDDSIGNDGGFYGGWSITFVTGSVGPAAPSTPDLHPASDLGSSNSDDITKDTTPTFRGTATAGTQVRLYIDTQPVAEASISGGAYLVSSPGALGDGQHVITVRALDAQGNEGPASGELTITIDATPPASPGTPDLSPESDPNNDNITTDATPTFTGSAPVDATTVILQANGTVVASAAPNPDGTYSLTPTSPMAPGNYDVRVGAVDIAGNNADPSGYVSITIQPGGAEPGHVSQVYLSGSAWAASFKSYLAAQGQGSAQYGFAVPAADQLNELPWTNLNQVSITFDQSATVKQADLSVRGVTVPTYTITTFNYDAPTKTATWTLAQPIVNDKVLIDLNGDAGGVAFGGVALDGDWNNAGDTFPSGNGTAGGDFRFRVNVLPGDVNRGGGSVNAIDLSNVRSRQLTSTSSPGTAPNTYNAFSDVNGSGNINAVDLGGVRSNQLKALPGAEPTGSAPSVLLGTAAARKTVTADFFADGPVVPG